MQSILQPSRIRLAFEADVPALRRLIEVSVRALHAPHHTPAEIEASIGGVFGVDLQLIRDETYFVVEAEGRVVGCGGWSRRRTLYGSDAFAQRDQSELVPGVDPAKIRAFFVDPAWARRGVATRLLEASETAAASAGFTSAELAATLSGEPFYLRQGYAPIERAAAPMRDGLSVPVIRMTKPLATMVRRTP